MNSPRCLPRWCLRAVLWCVPPALLAVPVPSPASGHRQDPNISIRFNVQATTFDTSFAARVMVGTPPREVLVEKIPAIIERDIASFYPYQAADGSYGAAFQLDRHGQVILESISSARRGSLLVVQINQRPVAALLIDKIIRDGIIYLPSGIAQPELRAMGASFLITGRDRVGPNRKPKSPEDLNPLAPR